VNNDPVNFLDEFGLSASDNKAKKEFGTLGINNIQTQQKLGLKLSDNTLDTLVAKIAESLVGTKYKRGGDKPSSEGGIGLDCSGLVQLSGERASGVNFKDRTVDEMFKDPNLFRTGSGQPGSVNLYDETGDGTYDHITVVAENNKEVHPSSNKGSINLVDKGFLDSYFDTKVNKEFNWDYIKGE